MHWLWDLLGWTLALAGVLLLAWSLFADRARSRRRCGRCWYDMSATPGLKCPECGREHKAEPGLHKTRRRWGWVVVALFPLLAAYPAAHVDEAKTVGWPACVPRTALIFLWPAVESWEFKRAQATGINSTPWSANSINRLMPAQLWSWQRWLHGWNCGRVLDRDETLASSTALVQLSNLNKDMGAGRQAYLRAFLDPARRPRYFRDNGFPRFMVSPFQNHPKDIARIMEAINSDPSLLGDTPFLPYLLADAGVDITVIVPRYREVIQNESSARAGSIVGQIPESLGQDTLDELFRLALRRGGGAARVAADRLLLYSDRDFSAFTHDIIPLLQDQTGRKTAAMALAWIGPPAAEALPALEAVRNDKDPAVALAVRSAIAAITQTPDQVAGELTAPAVKDYSHDWNAAILIGATKPDPSIALPALVKIVEAYTKNNMVRGVAFRSIARYGLQAADLAPWLAKFILDFDGTPDLILKPACDALVSMGPVSRKFAKPIRNAAVMGGRNGQILMDCAQRLDAMKE
jgi:hypothetical protein